MTYVYLLQPAEYLNTNCYKIGISSTCNLNRLKSYGVGTKYIRYFQCNNYKEAESELIKELNSRDNIVLCRGREYFSGKKADILEVFTIIMNKYTRLEIEELEKDSENNNKVKENNTNFKQKTDVPDMKKSAVNLTGQETKKQVQDLEMNKSCPGCLKVFSKKYNKTRHEKACVRYLSLMSKNIIVNQERTTVVLNTINSYEMSIKKLKSKKTSDCFKRVILSYMEEQKADIMDFVGDFDALIDKELENEKLRGHDCEYSISNFSLSEETISRCIADVLLKDSVYIVTHMDINLDGKYVFLFKHLNELHNDNILLEFIQRSKRQERLNMSKDFKPVSVLKQRYPEFYKSLEKDAMKFINKYNESSRLVSISTFNR